MKLHESRRISENETTAKKYIYYVQAIEWTDFKNHFNLSGPGQNRKKKKFPG